MLMQNTVSLLRYLCVCQEVRDKAATYALMKHVVDLLQLYSVKIFEKQKYSRNSYKLLKLMI